MGEFIEEKFKRNERKEWKRENGKGGEKRGEEGYLTFQFVSIKLNQLLTKLTSLSFLFSAD